MNDKMNAKNPTERQGQFLAYIFQYGLVNGCSPAEADMQRYFQITAPSVHSMVLTLERREFISQVPGKARSITLLIPPESVPALKRASSAEVIEPMLNETQRLARLYERKLAALEALKKSLLHQAFSGKL